MFGIFNSIKDISEFLGSSVGWVGAVVAYEQKPRDFVALASDAHSREGYSRDLCQHPLLLELMSRFTDRRLR